MAYKNIKKWEPVIFFEKITCTKVWKTFFKSTQQDFKREKSVNAQIVGLLCLSTPMFWKLLNFKMYSWLATLNFPAAFTFVHFVKALILYQSPLSYSNASSAHLTGKALLVLSAVPHDKQLGSMEKTLTIDWKRVWTWSFTICCWRL